MWERFYSLPFRYIKDTTLLWFQYRLLHRSLGTNSFLHMIHYVDSNKCNVCKNALFYDCHKVKNIWKALQEWIFEKLKMRISLNKHIVMFGMINGEKKSIICS